MGYVISVEKKLLSLTVVAGHIAWFAKGGLRIP